ncbi:cytochrome P450 [Actinokineospora globicatena]|uniref:Cytochrome P450 n=1 Tax=Actinokineospora globicatena TaxID=103729 RepID=A0A9W6QGX8_9PSEU|nr:cytochrome P450 [Actinokineospora globicatena]GLW89876.1 hypothetical protein Aglo03_06920 [Actinokineospora globicatena]
MTATSPLFRPYTAKQPNPWPELAADRARCPVAHNTELDAVQVTSYAGVKEALRNHAAFSSTYSNLWPLDAPLPEYKQVLGAADPPRHTRQRKLLVRALSASRVATMRPFSETLANQLVDDILAAGPRFDLITDYARKISEAHVAELLGIPDEDRPSFAHMATLIDRHTDALVDEGLRYDGPVLGLWRRCLAPAQVQDIDVAETSKLFVAVAAANHDPVQFDDPDTFRLDRHDASTHLTFGAGIHLCVGMNLARLELTTAVATLYRRLPDLHLTAGGTEQVPGPLIRSWRHIDMEYDRTPFHPATN